MKLDTTVQYGLVKLLYHWYLSLLLIAISGEVVEGGTQGYGSVMCEIIIGAVWMKTGCVVHWDADEFDVRVLEHDWHFGAGIDSDSGKSLTRQTSFFFSAFGFVWLC